MTKSKQEYCQDDNIYLVNYLGRTQAEELAPFSARSGVSSFNLPIQYGSALVTPVSMTNSPALTPKSIPSTSESNIKLSPGPLSPTHGIYSPDSDFESKYNPPMKHKYSSGVLDNFFPPGSPYICSSPYWGSYGVSAQPIKTSASSPTFNQSPNMQSSADYSSNGYYSRNQTPALSTTSYKSNTPVHIVPRPSSPPILQSPHPSSLKPATGRYNTGGCRQYPASSNQMSRPFQRPAQDRYAPSSHCNSTKVEKANSKRNKTPPGFYERLLAVAQNLKITDQERILLELSVRDQLPWNALMDSFNTTFPSAKGMTVAALQMKKKRLVEKLQDWTDVEKRALELSVEKNKGKWKAVASDMKKFGAKSKWSAEACEKQWDIMRPKDSQSHCEMAQTGDYRRQRTSSSEFSNLSVDQQSWSDGAESMHHNSFADDASHLVSALSSATMNDTRSRAVGDASVQIQQQHLRNIQQMVYSQCSQPSLSSYQPQRQQHHTYQSRNNNWISGP